MTRENVILLITSPLSTADLPRPSRQQRSPRRSPPRRHRSRGSHRRQVPFAARSHHWSKRRHRQILLHRHPVRRPPSPMPVLLAEPWCPFATAAASALKRQCTTAVAVAVAHESTPIPSPLSSSVTAVVSGRLHERLRRRPHPLRLSLSHHRQGPPSPSTPHRSTTTSLVEDDITASL